MIVPTSRPAAVAEQPIPDARVLVVEARFYDALSDLLLDGALRRLRGAGVTTDRIIVPGSLEIPPAVAIALDRGDRRRRAL